MLSFLISRILQGIAVVFAVLVLTFALQKLSPSSPFNSERNITEEQRARYAAYFGYDLPWYAQLGRHIRAYATLDLPDCLKKPGRGVGEVITQAPRQQPSTHGAPRPNNTLMTLGFQMVTKLGAHIPDPAKACLLGPTNST